MDLCTWREGHLQIPAVGPTCQKCGTVPLSTELISFSNGLLRKVSRDVLRYDTDLKAAETKPLLKPRLPFIAAGASLPPDSSGLMGASKVYWRSIPTLLLRRANLAWKSRFSWEWRQSRLRSIRTARCRGDARAARRSTGKRLDDTKWNSALMKRAIFAFNRQFPVAAPSAGPLRKRLPLIFTASTPSSSDCSLAAVSEHSNLVLTFFLIYGAHRGERSICVFWLAPVNRLRGVWRRFSSPALKMTLKWCRWIMSENQRRINTCSQ